MAIVLWNRFKTFKNPDENPDLPTDFKNPNEKCLRLAKRLEVWEEIHRLALRLKNPWKIYKLAYGFLCNFHLSTVRHRSMLEICTSEPPLG
jgi:hypothetical protein